MKKHRIFSSPYLKDLKNFDKKTTLWILKSSRSQLFNIILLSVLYSVIAYTGVLMAQLARGIVDSAAYEHSAEGVIFFGCAVLGLTIFQVVLRILSSVTDFNINAKLEIAIKTKLFNCMLNKDYSKITSYHTGELLNRLTSDVNVITGTITSIVPSVCYFIVKLTGAFIILFCIDWKFAIVLVVGGLLLMLVALLFKGTLKNYHKKAQETDGKTRSFLQESLASILVIKVFNAYNRIKKESDKLQWDNFKIKRKRNYFSIMTSTGFSFVFAAAYIYGLIWGSFSILNGVITYGVLTEILSLVSQIQSPIQGLTSILPTYYQALASAERIMEIEKMDDEHCEDNNININVKTLYDKLSSIEFENITFGYNSETVLENTSLSINKGDFVVITGISGIGKSTLTKLLLDVFPVNEGKIYLKMKDGSQVLVDKNIRSMFAYVPQGNFLLSGTIRENISFVRPDATDEEIKYAAKVACADFIDDLPDGLETVIGEKGFGLSEGQVQRVAIARALICNSPIILLDEATSALDEATEIKLLKNIENLQNKTCILISHKKAANEVCNKEVRIENKKIIVKDI